MGNREALRLQFRIYFPYFIVIAAICHLDRILLGKYAAIDIYDSVEVHFVHFKAISLLIKEYGLFGWYPVLAGGQPVFASQHPPYALPVLLSGILPIWSVSLLWVLILQTAAGWGIYRLLREIVQADDKICVFLAGLYSIIFAYGIVHLVYCFMFPLHYVWTKDLFDRRLGRLHRCMVLIGIMLIMLTAFPVLTLPHFPVFHFFLVLYFEFNKKSLVRSLAQTVLVWTAFVLIYTPLIINLYQYIPQAQRTWTPEVQTFTAAFVDFLKNFVGRFRATPLIVFTMVYSFYSLTHKSFRTPLLFVLVPLVLSSIFGSKMKDYFAQTFLVKMDLFLSATVLPISCIIILSLLLQFHWERRKRIASWLLVLSLLLVSIGLSEFKILRLLFLTSLILLFLTQRTNFGMWTGRFHFIFPILFALLVMFGRQEYASVGMVVPLAQGIESHVNLSRLRELAKQEPFRVANIDVHPAVAQSYGLETIDLKFPVFNKNFKEIVAAALSPQFFGANSEQRFLDVWRQMYLTRLKADHDQRPLFLETGSQHSTAEFNIDLLMMMNVRYLLASKPLLDIGPSIKLEFIDPGLTIPEWLPVAIRSHYSRPIYAYRLEGALPRAYMAKGVRVYDRPTEMLAAMKTFTSPQETAFLLKKEGLPEVANGSRNIGTLNDANFTPGSIQIRGESNEAGVVVILNNWDPHWVAEVNGKPAPVHRTNHAFQSVAINPGAFTLDMKYNNPPVVLAHWATLTGVMLLMSGLVLKKTRDEELVGEEAAAKTVAANSIECALPKGIQLMVQALLVPALWALAYYVLVMGKAKSPNVSWLGYILVTTPVIGCLVALWARRLTRTIYGTSL